MVQIFPEAQAHVAIFVARAVSCSTSMRSQLASFQKPCILIVSFFTILFCTDKEPEKNPREFNIEEKKYYCSKKEEEKREGVCASE